jgi:4-diphosphocytidyl-2-C-methyl-D-erythritol kinase
MICFPNCKINLGLFITEKRPDGYHTLESIFLPGPITDALEITPRTDHQFVIKQYNATFDIPMEQHSCYKAWHLLHQKHGINGVEVNLIKKIPSGAGLGGGSSDAAFTLKMLNEIYYLSLSTAQLLDYAAELGSDDAFFIYNQPCFLKGRGHELIPMDWAFPFEIKISSPNVSISTSEAYAHVHPSPSPFDLLSLPSIPKEEWKNIVVNDFQSGAIARFPIIQQHIDNMYKNGAFYAAMSGSGSSVFGLFD